MKISLQQFDLDYFCQLFVMYCNKICKVTVYYYKIFKIVNFLLQQHIYDCIRIFIKIFEFYCKKKKKKVLHKD